MGEGPVLTEGTAGAKALRQEQTVCSENKEEASVGGGIRKNKAGGGVDLERGEGPDLAGSCRQGR